MLSKQSKTMNSKSMKRFFMTLLVGLTMMTGASAQGTELIDRRAPLSLPSGIAEEETTFFATFNTAIAPLFKTYSYICTQKT